jgi:hypothetical protein
MTTRITLSSPGVLLQLSCNSNARRNRPHGKLSSGPQPSRNPDPKGGGAWSNRGRSDREIYRGSNGDR